MVTVKIRHTQILKRFRHIPVHFRFPDNFLVDKSYSKILTRILDPRIWRFTVRLLYVSAKILGELGLFSKGSSLVHLIISVHVFIYQKFLGEISVCSKVIVLLLPGPLNCYFTTVQSLLWPKSQSMLCVYLLQMESNGQNLLWPGSRLSTSSFLQNYDSAFLRHPRCMC